MPRVTKAPLVRRPFLLVRPWGGPRSRAGRAGFQLVVVRPLSFTKTKSVRLRNGSMRFAMVPWAHCCANSILNPRITDRPWRILCDGERFLHSKDAKKEYSRHSISLWTIPAHSPDLNPIEKFWSWLRRELRSRDLADFRNKRIPLSKEQYIRRVKQVLQSTKANQKAANIAGGFRKVCKEVLKKKGAAARS